MFWSFPMIGVAEGTGTVVADGNASVVVPRASMQRMMLSLRSARQEVPIADYVEISSVSEQKT